ncbi:MAG: methyl-accepting chemotaxis protein [Desulfobacterales bacterium]|nr:methyl-accepting chemotaxis protein [Desulfobacterales bacterium]
MQIRFKLYLIAGGLSLIILLMFCLTWYTTSAQKTDGLLINLAGRQRMLTQKMSKEVLMVLETEKNRAQHIKAAQGTARVFDMTLTALLNSGQAPKGLTPDGPKVFCPQAEEPALGQLKKVKQSWTAFSREMKSILADPSHANGSLDYVMTKNLPLLKEMNTAVTMLQKNSEKKVDRLILFQTLCLGLGLVIMALSILLIRGIVRQLTHASENADAMAQGDLTRRFHAPDKPKDKLNEMEFLGHSLNGFADTLQNAMAKINAEALQLKSASADMNQVSTTLSQESGASADTSRNVADNAEQMSEDMNAVAAAMEELTANTQEIAGSSSQINQTIRDISQAVDEAGTISNQAVERVETASSRVDNLGDAARHINKVSETINDISEQTNLLALNATIEAARAGEAGKGFAVVAGEIKNLAGQTTEATEQIKSHIESIQGTTHSTISDIKSISEIIAQVNTIVATIAQSVQEQTQTVSEIDMNVSQGAEAVQEVSANVANSSMASRDVSQDISEVSGSISQVSTHVEQISGNAEQLDHLAGELHAMVARFKIE